MPRPDPAEDLAEYLDEVHQDIAEFAGRHLEEDERDEFIDSLLERHGYQRVSKWAAPDDSGSGGSGSQRKPLVKPRTGSSGGNGGGRGGQGQGRSPYFKR